MKAIIAVENALKFVQFDPPAISPSQCLVQIKYAGVNRADLLQKKGLYPPPDGESEILGLEFSGEIVEVGSDVNVFNKGDEVCSIVGSGSYAEYVAVEASHLIAKPENLGLQEAAALPEAFITTYQSLVKIADLKASEKILIHAGASGVGSAAIQMAKAIGAYVVVTASAGKHEYCFNLGADECIDYKKNAFDKVVSKVDVVLDLIGGNYFQGNLNVLAPEGRMVMLGFLGGVKSGDANIAGIVTKRLQIEGSTLRARDKSYKAMLVQGLVNDFILDGQFPFKTNVDKVFDFEDAEDAHRFMEENKNSGKIILKM